VLYFFPISIYLMQFYSSLSLLFCVTKIMIFYLIVKLFLWHYTNGVADKRRPRTGLPLKKQQLIIIKNIYLTELIYTNNFTRKSKANNYINAECEHGVRLIGMLAVALPKSYSFLFKSVESLLLFPILHFLHNV
jgi:hypothetical protein